MKLTVLGSSSKGNGYVIQSDTEALILEAGVRLNDVKKALDFNISKVKGCFVSHVHGDHSKYLNEYEQVFPTFANMNVIDTMKLSRTKPIQHLNGKIAGGFTVLCFDASHDVPCLGFVIKHNEMGTLLFLTDSFKLEYDFANINHFLIECNYTDNALNKAVEDGITHPYLKNRLMTTHLSLGSCCKILKRHDLTSLSNIILLHLSDNNSDEQEMISEVKKATGRTPLVARTGLETELNNKPY